jgi:hypothetical protein
VDTERLFPRPLGAHCGHCDLLELCGAERTDNACTPRLDFTGPGGPFAIHPLRTDFEEHFRRVGGAGFDDIVGKPIESPGLSSHLPQVRWLTDLCTEDVSAAGYSAVGVRLKEVFRGGRLRTADELRAKTGLREDIAIVLLLHGKDALLEALEERGLSSEIAQAGYALVTAPSFSLWEPQRRPDNLMSLRRSLLAYAELLRRGVPVCPRVGWVESRDVERLAGWANHHGLSLVSLDLMTYAGRSFDHAVTGLASFDELTCQRLRYLVDGVRSRARIEALYFAAARDRITISSATMAPPISGGAVNNTFLARADLITAVCAAASRNVAAANTSTVDEFISQALQHHSRIAATEAARIAREPVA